MQLPRPSETLSGRSPSVHPAIGRSRDDIEALKISGSDAARAQEMHGKKLSAPEPLRSVALGRDLIEVEHPSNHPIPPSYEYELFSNPNPSVAAWRTTQASLFPIVHHPIEKLPRKHLTRAPLRAATEISVGVLAVLVVVPILLRKRTIVILVSLTNCYTTEHSQC